jgi:hypothetical protein
MIPRLVAEPPAVARGPARRALAEPARHGGPGPAPPRLTGGVPARWARPLTAVLVPQDPPGFRREAYPGATPHRASPQRSGTTPPSGTLWPPPAPSGPRRRPLAPAGARARPPAPAPPALGPAQPSRPRHPRARHPRPRRLRPRHPRPRRLRPRQATRPWSRPASPHLHHNVIKELVLLSRHQLLDHVQGQRRNRASGRGNVIPICHAACRESKRQRSPRTHVAQARERAEPGTGYRQRNDEVRDQAPHSRRRPMATAAAWGVPRCYRLSDTGPEGDRRGAVHGVGQCPHQLGCVTAAWVA